MIVANHHNQLSEAYRVLEDGGVAGFTVWGREENSSWFSFVPEVFNALGFKYIIPPRSSFHLSNKNLLVEDTKATGFKEVKAFYTMTNPEFCNTEDIYHATMNAPHGKTSYDLLNDEEKEIFKNKFFEMYEERFGKESSEMLTWETLVIIARK
mmetsp:Transcript_9600/g.8452  ORF Transcript_9600/g.8452 Transcript_9600/m.8452 type:complete len:153 (+) Transcript_9600:485-943(+)